MSGRKLLDAPSYIKKKHTHTHTHIKSALYTITYFQWKEDISLSSIQVFLIKVYRRPVYGSQLEPEHVAANRIDNI